MRAHDVLFYDDTSTWKNKVKLQSILKWFSSILPHIVSFSVSTRVLNQARNELVFADIHI